MGQRPGRPSTHSRKGARRAPDAAPRKQSHGLAAGPHSGSGLSVTLPHPRRPAPGLQTGLWHPAANPTSFLSPSGFRRVFGPRLPTPVASSRPPPTAGAWGSGRTGRVLSAGPGGRSLPRRGRQPSTRSPEPPPPARRTCPRPSSPPAICRLSAIVSSRARRPGRHPRGAGA